MFALLFCTEILSSSLDSVLSEQLMAEETGFYPLVLLCPTMTLCVLLPLVLELLHLFHFLPTLFFYT